MKELIKIKAGELLSLLLFLSSFALANNNPYILESDGLIDSRAELKIFEIGKECEAKTGVRIYIYAKENYPLSSTKEVSDKIAKIKQIETAVIKNLKKPYVVLTLALNQTHVNLLLSDDLESIIDKNDILDGYVVPLLASKDKNKLFVKVSAAMLNGYAQIADEIALSKGIKLESSIGSEGKTAGTIWKVFMYFLIVTGLILYIYAVMKSKK